VADSQYLPAYGYGQPGSVPQGAQGGAMSIPFRSGHDAALSGMAGYVPSAQYPDGYLGTIQSRREDRLLDTLKNKINQRSYQRGVHKGEKIDAADYYWPAELQPDRGLRMQAQAVQQPPDRTLWVQRQAPLGTLQEQMIVSGASELPTSPRGKVRPTPTVYDRSPDRAGALKALAPAWR
jgi:hypothetical protein